MDSARLKSASEDAMLREFEASHPDYQSDNNTSWQDRSFTGKSSSQPVPPLVGNDMRAGHFTYPPPFQSRPANPKPRGPFSDNTIILR